MNNQKKCWFCHSGAMKFQPITNKKGEIISLHNICQVCNKNQTLHSLKKRKSSQNSNKSTKPIKRKSRLLQGTLVMLVALALSYSGCNALAETLSLLPQAATSTPLTVQQQSTSTAEIAVTPKRIEMTTKAEVRSYVLAQASSTGVWVAKIDHMVENESHYNPKAIGDMQIICARTGKPVRARGLWQITQCYHPEISDAQAFDPEWSTAWALNIIANSKKDCVSQWTQCAKWYQ